MAKFYMVYERGGEGVGTYCQRHAAMVAAEAKADTELSPVGEFGWIAEADATECDLAALADDGWGPCGQEV